MYSRVIVLAALALVTAQQALSQQVVPCPPFPAPAFLRQDYNGIAFGAYLSINAFPLGVASRLQPQNALLVFNQPLPLNSPPNMMYGRGTDVDWQFLFPVRRFGGWFKSAHPTTTAARFTLYDATNNMLGTFTVPVFQNQWIWYGWCWTGT
ncbi:MAG: hypothetical protein C4340_06725 [Armatimonadota bacterium]